MVVTCWADLIWYFEHVMKIQKIICTSDSFLFTLGRVPAKCLIWLPVAKLWLPERKIDSRRPKSKFGAEKKHLEA